MKVMRGSTRVGILVQNKTGSGQWSDRLEGSARQAIQEAGYFTLVDLENRKTRLQELSYSQSGMTANMQEIGKEISADGLLYIKINQDPKTECTVEEKQVQEQKCIRTDSQGKCLEYSNSWKTVRTGILKVQTGLAGDLVNVETGEFLSYNHSATDSYRNTDGYAACPSVLESIQSSISSAATNLARNLSPIVSHLDVTIMDSSDTIEHSRNDEISSLLEAGVKAVEQETPLFREAEKNWKEAWSISGQKCPEASWNLGVLAWHDGNMSLATGYFEKAFEAGGMDWKTEDDLLELYSKFQGERERMSLMKK